MTFHFDLQGHRGARGQRPENTLPSFEAALDAGVTSIETDLLLTADDRAVLYHDPLLSDALFLPGDPTLPSAEGRPVRGSTLAELRRYRVGRNPYPAFFPEQIIQSTPLTERFASAADFHPLAVPTPADLFAFAAFYAGDASKTKAQRRQAALVRFDLELKRLPFFSEAIGDGYDGTRPALLEKVTVQAIQAADLFERTTVRSFDHRCVRLIKELEPRVRTALLMADTAVEAPEEMVRAAGAEMYCPDYRFLDAVLVCRLKKAGVKVLPWTVNDVEHARRLLSWGVDGVTTDFPARLGMSLG